MRRHGSATVRAETFKKHDDVSAAHRLIRNAIHNIRHIDGHPPVSFDPSDDGIVV